MEISIFQSKFSIFKGVSPRNVRQNKKKYKNFQVSWYDDWRPYINIILMKIVQFIWCRWKISFFGQNSRFLKVLAHEMSYEIQKKIKIFEFHGMMKGCFK